MTGVRSCAAARLWARGEGRGPIPVVGGTQDTTPVSIIIAAAAARAVLACIADASEAHELK
jgi:hypothetical protein